MAAVKAHILAEPMVDLLAELTEPNSAVPMVVLMVDPKVQMMVDCSVEHLVSHSAALMALLKGVLMAARSVCWSAEVMVIESEPMMAVQTAS